MLFETALRLGEPEAKSKGSGSGNGVPSGQYKVSVLHPSFLQKKNPVATTEVEWRMKPEDSPSSMYCSIASEPLFQSLWNREWVGWLDCFWAVYCLAVGLWHSLLVGEVAILWPSPHWRLWSDHGIQGGILNEYEDLNRGVSPDVMQHGRLRSPWR